jgi:exopolysaccharide biosynthesis polyprenyl glycosylphosphotransferase
MSEQIAPAAGMSATATALELRDYAPLAVPQSKPAPSWLAPRLTIDAGSLLVAAFVVAGQADAPLQPLSMLAAAILSLIGFASVSLYRPRLHLRLGEELRRLVVVTAVAFMTVAAAELLLQGAGSGDAAIVHWLLATTLVASGRLTLAGAERLVRRTQAGAGGATLIVGAGRVGRVLAQRLLDEPQLGLRPVGFLDKDPLADANGNGSSPAPDLPVLGSSYDLERVVREGGIENVLVAFSTAPSHVMLDLVRRCWRLGVSVMVVPRLYEIEGRRARTEHVGALPIVSLSSVDPRGWAFRVKYALDRVGAALGLVVLAPLFAVVALAVLVTMGRPVLFRQRRVGRDGHVFEMLKFRTMRGSPDVAGEQDARWAWLAVVEGGHETRRRVAPAPSAPDGDRVTRLGSLLRRLSLDELPQFWNVARGDMSLVGPRPERVNYVERFQEAIYRYPDRHRVKSGLTGWAQVHGLRGETSLADRIEWDNFYIENWSPWLDIKIVLMTLPTLFRGRGRH